MGRKFIQISLLGKIYGNVNADEVIGTRITLKKMYDSQGNVYPFVSPRAIKYAIRQALKEKGYEIDPYIKDPDINQLNDSGDPEKYIDNDLFGYLTTKRGGKKGEGGSISRQAPIALSYFKALFNTPINTEFAARFPRLADEEVNPVPFEVEVAEFIGKLNCIIYDYVGKKDEFNAKEKDFTLPEEERRKRLKDFLEIFLTPSYVLPRRTNSLNVPEYLYGIICMSEGFVFPIFKYLSVDSEKGTIDENKIDQLINDLKIFTNSSSNKCKLFLIDYGNNYGNLENVEIKKVSEIINEVLEFYF
jgi:CRISPR-associated protein Cst2